MFKAFVQHLSIQFPGLTAPACTLKGLNFAGSLVKSTDTGASLVSPLNLVLTSGNCELSQCHSVLSPLDLVVGVTVKGCVDLGVRYLDGHVSSV